LIEPVDLPNFCRGCATAVSCRAASCTSSRACPFPVCTSVAHLEPRYCDHDSTVLPWPPTDVPEPSGQQGCRMYPEAPTGCKRTPFGAVTSIRSHDVQMVPHAHATRRRLSGAQAAAAAAQPRSMCIARSDPRLAGSPAGANRPAEAALCLESRARISWRRPKYAGFGDSVRRAQQVNIQMDWEVGCDG